MANLKQETIMEEIFQGLSNGKSLDELCTILYFKDFVNSGKTGLSARFRLNPDSTSPDASGNTFFDIPLSEEQLNSGFLADINPENINQLGKSLVLSEFGIAVIPDGLTEIINSLSEKELTVCADGSKVYQLNTESIHKIMITLLGSFDEQEEDGETSWHLKQEQA